MCTTRRDVVGEFGRAGLPVDAIDGGKAEARGVGSGLSTAVSSVVDEFLDSEVKVLIESLRCTCLNGDAPSPSRDGVLKLNVFAGSGS